MMFTTLCNTLLGYYATAGSDRQTACPIGTYNSEPAQESCLTCDAGFICPSEGMSTPIACEAGTYCPAGSYFAVDCPVGTYSNQYGQR